jgi:SAM-dependent methyltransferase
VENTLEPVPQPIGDASSLLEINCRFYDALWRDTNLVEPERFNTWSLVCSLVSPGQRRLEVAPGLRPRLPLDGTQFFDVSATAVAKLRARGASALRGVVTALPFADAAFDLICACDIVEHVADDDQAWSELARVSAPGATLLVSVPLHASHWTAFDDFVGHGRRYEPDQLPARLAQHGFAIERSAIFGMQPKSTRLVELGMWFLVNRRERALWCYNKLFMPLGVRFQRKLSLAPGLIDTTDVDEVLLVCRRNQAV